MFLLGIDINHRAGQGTIVIIKKRLKNVRHYYTVQRVVSAPPADCPDEVMKLYRDSRCHTRKRVFSQDRRPKKDVSAHPLIIAIVAENDRSLVDTVRKSDIPVEALLLTGENPAPETTNPAGSGLGRDLAVSGKMLLKAAITVAEQQRLVIEATTPEAERLRYELEEIMNRLDGESGGHDSRPEGLLPALAAPLWYRENVRYRQVYRTSSTCVRQYR